MSVDGQSDDDDHHSLPVDYIKSKIDKMNENLNRLEKKYVVQPKNIETGTIKTVNEFDGSFKSSSGDD